MKPLTEMTAAELVGELAKAELFLQEVPHSSLHRREAELLTAELERRCERAGILIDPDGFPVFFNFDHCTHFYAPDPRMHESTETITGKPVARVNVKAEDVKDLLGYLLAKGGKG